MPVRFTAAELRAIESAARVNKQSVSAWVRGVIQEALGVTLPKANQMLGSRSNDPRRIREGQRNFAADSNA
jgi:hypothetical protein